MKLLRFGFLCIVICLVIGFYNPPSTSASQLSAEIEWQTPLNVSKSPDRTSTDPFLIPDPAGPVHLFWAEKMNLIEGNQPDTLLYTAWDGATWRRPVDLFFATGGTPLVAYPHGVMDDHGKIHLFWLSQPNFPNYTLYYSNAPASKAGNALDWKPEERLVDDLTGTQYSIDVKYRSPGELHVIFARVQQGASPPEERAVSYIHSIDYGETWSDPIDIYSFPSIEHGGSNTRLILDRDQIIYTTWTEWDGTGNGLRVWFCRSVDNGNTWETPIMLSERLGNEYERDWAAITLLDEGQIVVMWEGGWRAYRNAQYSFDAGVTWTRPIDTFPWLIGENGFVEFARDSNGTLHAFLSQRLREGYSYYGETDSSALWHSVWEGNQRWSEPVLANGFNPMLNPKVVIFNGNRVMAVWYTIPTLEIITMQGVISGAPAIKNRPVVTTIDSDLPEMPGKEAPTSTSVEQVDQQRMPTETELASSLNPSPNIQEESFPTWRVGGLAIIGSVLIVIVLWMRRKR